MNYEDLTPSSTACLDDAFALGMLAGQKESPNELAVAADKHSREPLVPLACGDFRLAVQPACKEFQLLGTDAAVLYTIQQVLEDARRNIGALDFRQGLDSVKSPSQTLPQARGLRRVGGGGQFFCEQPELFRTELIALAFKYGQFWCFQ